MHSRKQTSIQLIAAFVLLGILIFFDFLFYLNGKFPAGVKYLREIFILMTMTAFYPVIKRNRFIENKDVLTKLKGLYIAIAGIYTSYVLLKIGLGPISRIIKIKSRSPDILFGSFGSFFYSMIFSLFTAVILINAFLLLKDLIFIKRKRSSSRNFILLVSFLCLHIVIVNLKELTLPSNFHLFRNEMVGETIFYILIVLMVVNSFRNSWVNYFNKSQKINCLWLGIPLFVGAIILESYIIRDPALQAYSVSLAGLTENMGLFLNIYIGMSFISLLLHLPTAGIFDRKIREIESLHDLSRTLPFVFDSNKIIQIITKNAAAAMNSDALWLQMTETPSRSSQVLTSSRIKGHNTLALQQKPADELDDWIVQNKQSVLINETAKDPRCESLKKWHHSINSIVGVPLVSKNGVTCILYSGKIETFAYDEEDRILLQAFANQASIALENARLMEELVAKERFEQELKIAQDAQKKLLPKSMPRIRGLDVDAISITANEVGGDYYDFYKLEEKLAVAVGDVSGKGAKAAFYMAELKGIIESLSNIYTSPKELMVHINQSLCRNLDRTSFISLIYSIIDPIKKELIFARAGHCPLLICSGKNGETQFLEPPGLGLGLEYSVLFAETLVEEKLKLNTGDVLIFYTDGVIEARNVEKKEFEQNRLRKLVAENYRSSASQIKELLVKEIQDFVGKAKSHDDLTFIVAKVN